MSLKQDITSEQAWGMIIHHLKVEEHTEDVVPTLDDIDAVFQDVTLRKLMKTW